MEKITNKEFNQLIEQEFENAMKKLKFLKKFLTEDMKKEGLMKSRKKINQKLGEGKTIKLCGIKLKRGEDGIGVFRC